MERNVKTSLFQKKSISLRINRNVFDQLKKGTKDTKATVKLINLIQTDKAMAKNEKDKQTTAYTTQHRKLKNKQHEPLQKLGVISGAPEG